VLLDFDSVLSCSKTWTRDSPDFVEPARWQNEGVARIDVIPNWLGDDDFRKLRHLQRRATWVRARLHNADAESRLSDCSWIAPEASACWLYKKLASTFIDQNKRYRYDLRGFNEGPQFVRYKAGGVLDWHIDIGPGPTSVRKLALVALVARSDDCEGGELEFLRGNGLVPMVPGTAIVFPSFIAHRVTKIRTGSRIALVAWACGPAFR
jgi:PKHD-type hydroxylase